MANLGAIDTQKLQDIGLLRPDASPKKKELGQDAFLKLMVTQMKNQNPMEPQDNSEFLSQMAQFGTVDGISKLQNSFSALSASLQSNQALQASALVGRKVLVPAQTGLLTQGGTIAGQVELPNSVSQLSLGVYNTQGELVRRVNLGDSAPGKIKFEWDGKTENGDQAAVGQYYVRAEASSEGVAKSYSTEIAANVDSVTLAENNGELQLNLAGVGTVPFSRVKQIQ